MTSASPSNQWLPNEPETGGDMTDGSSAPDGPLGSISEPMTEPGLLADVYRARFDGKVAYRRQVWGALVANLFVPRLGNPKRVLDLAAGYGDFINNISADAKFAIDLNPDAKVHLDPDVELFAIDATTPWPITEGSLDAVFTSNFFEHLGSPDALLGVLSQASRSLRPGGRLIAIGPNMRYTLKEYWDFLDHRLPLTERSLKEAIELRGFRVIECVPRLLPYSMDSHRQVPAALVALYCRTPLLWRFFGKQFLLVAERLP